MGSRLLQGPPIPFQYALITVGTMASKQKWDERVLRRLKLRDLRVLLAIAETGSMGKTAAHESRMTSPSMRRGFIRQT